MFGETGRSVAIIENEILRTSGPITLIEMGKRRLRLQKIC